ncbi:MAG: hypothetical protein ACYDBJ_04440 [Aggregatilineales bacterium]
MNKMPTFTRMAVLTITIASVFMLVAMPQPAQAAAATSGTITSPANGAILPFCGFTIKGTLSGGTNSALMFQDGDGSAIQWTNVSASAGTFSLFFQWTDDPGEFSEPNETLTISLVTAYGSFTTIGPPITVTMQPSCGGPSALGCGLTDGGYQDALAVNTKLYWGAAVNQAVQPDTFIPAGQVVTVLDNSNPGWLHILWACNTYYIEVGGQTVNPATISKPYLAGK